MTRQEEVSLMVEDEMDDQAECQRAAIDYAKRWLENRDADQQNRPFPRETMRLLLSALPTDDPAA